MTSEALLQVLGPLFAPDYSCFLTTLALSVAAPPTVVFGKCANVALAHATTLYSLPLFISFWPRLNVFGSEFRLSVSSLLLVFQER